MRKGLLVSGIVVLVLGAALAAYGFTFLNSQAETVPAYPSYAEFSVPSIGSASVTISWSGAPSGTTVDVYRCSTGCASSEGFTASGSGSSGSVSFTAAQGQTYEIYAQGASSGVPATVKVTAISILDLIGIVLIVLGAVLVLLGAVMKARAPRPAAAEESMPVAADAGADADTMVMAPPPAQPTAAPVAGQRPPITCSYCGTVNEPWLTNCRKCKRPLTTTGA